MGAYVDNIKTSDGVTHPIQDATVFTGTLSQWNQLTTDQKKAYRFANFTDDLGSDVGITDAVTDGDMRAVTSNAVYDALGNAGVKTFIGTTDEWNLLSTEQKKAYEIVDITDDYDPTPDTPEIWGFIDHMNVLDPSQRIEYIKDNKNYTPLTINSTTHTADYGSWEDNPILKANVPAMIKANGTVDYYLDPDDYTKKLDGTASDVANTAYEGGAFAYIPKIYTKQYIKGNDRYVMFSMTKVNNDFKPTGFVDHLGNEYDGMWIPMFYETVYNENGIYKIKSLGTGTIPDYPGGSDLQKTYIENNIPTAKFFGGPIIPLLCDLLILFAKTTNMETAYGYGASLGTSGWPSNAIIDGGQFYGNWNGDSLNKVFHSILPITCAYQIRDPYTLLFNGRLKVSPYYYYDITDESGYLIDTGIDYEDMWITSGKMIYIPNYGAIVSPDSSSAASSTSLGYCDTYRVKTDISCSAATRFGHRTLQHANGPFYCHFEAGYSTNTILYTASPMVFGALSQQGGE